MKTCTKCGFEKPFTEFSLRKDTNRYRSQCKVCHNAANTARYFNNPATRQAHARAAHKFNLKRYGLTPDDYGRMRIEQQGLCAICCAPVDKPFVDHCHTTLKVRGLLCHLCNVGLGAFLDNPASLRAAADYVEHYASNVL